MNEEFKPYLEQFGVTAEKPLFQKVHRLLNLGTLLCPEQLETIFISEFINSDGKRLLVSLFFFSRHFMLEGKDFAGNKENIDITFIGNAIQYADINLKHYDFVQASDDSGLSIRITFSHGTDLTAEMHASRHNCDALREIYVNYLKPNIVKSGEVADIGSEVTAQ